MKSMYIGHRGASYLAPQNSLAALQLAWNLGADGAECDVQLTKDQKIIVFHDANGNQLLRSKLVIAQSNYKELKKLPIKLKASNLPQYKGQTPPLLSEALDVLPAKKLLIIEIKTDSKIIAPLQKIIQNHWKTGKIAFISFDFDCIIQLKKLYPAVECYYLAYQKRTLNKMFEKIVNSDLDGIDLDYKIINKSLVERYQKKGKKVWCWTVNNSRSALKMEKCGVVAITSDRPLWLKNKVARLKNKFTQELN